MQDTLLEILNDASSLAAEAQDEIELLNQCREECNVYRNAERHGILREDARRRWNKIRARLPYLQAQIDMKLRQAESLAQLAESKI